MLVSFEKIYKARKNLRLREKVNKEEIENCQNKYYV